jgi:hypothetical protein
LQIWHTLELLAFDERFPTLNDAPLKKLMEDSFKTITCFSRVVFVLIPFHSSLKGSNDVSPSSPKAFSTSLLATNITRGEKLCQYFFNIGITSHHA